MGLIMTHNPSGESIELGKEPDLPLNISEDENQDVIMTDAGRRKIFTRKIRSKTLTLSLQLLNHYERMQLTKFFKEVLNGRQELFDLDIQIDHEEPLQVGALQDGNPITVGTVLEEDCGSPGGPILVGDWVRQDRYIYENCRFDQDEIAFSDTMPRNFTTQIVLVQELP